MADKKISALTASATPLAGTEVLPIVQSGATVKVAVSDLTAGRAVSATQLTLTTENLVIGTAGKGIDFSANTHAAGMTSELLNDYEEGTWTPTVTVNSGTATGYTISKSVYTRIGREVTVKTEIIPTGGTFGNGTGYCGVAGLPFAPSGNFGGCMGNSANVTANQGAFAFTQSGAPTTLFILGNIFIPTGDRSTLQATYFV